MKKPPSTRGKRNRPCSLGVALALLLELSGCSGTPQRYEAQFLTLFDTVTTVVAYTHSRAEFESQVQFIYDRLEQYHQLYDIYNDYPGITNLKTINDHAGQVPVEADRRILDLLLYAKELFTLTDGAVNVAMGSVLSLWHDYRQAGVDDPAGARLPPTALLEATGTHTDLRNVILDAQAGTVFFADPALRLDVGAVAKGYAVAQVCQQAVENGFTSGLVSVGGNVYAIGGKDPRGTPWTVGVRSPWPGTDGAEETLCTVALANAALVTSGGYQRYYTVDGARYHHIIDPGTWMPADRYEAVSILCEDSGLADALSTAVFLLPLEDGMRLVESLPGVEALWVYSDRSTRSSSGFLPFLIEFPAGQN